ncbi:MAG: cadherin-like beta sandwich domain-containing protein [Paludibacter sp.]
MKTTTLFGIALAISSFFSVKAQTDMTSLITNSSFETGDLTGWTWTGTSGYAWLGPNTDGDATKDGTYICGIWNASIGDAECSQALTGLTNGFYKVTSLATVSTNRLTTQRLFATSGTTTKSTLYGASDNPAYTPANLSILGATETYSFGGYAESTAENGPFKKISVVTQVTDGNLTLGFRLNGKGSALGYDFSYSPNADAGFFKFDGFTLTEVSTAATLDNITLSSGYITPAFNSSTTTYTAILPVGTTSVTPTAVVSVDGEIVSGNDAVDVSSGSGSSSILVTALDGTTTNTYTINYTVLSLSDDATLSALETSVGTLYPAFSPTITTYLVLVPVGTSKVTPTATKNDAKASVSGDTEVTLVNGKGISTIVVTAENNTTKTYTINYDQAYITNPSFETNDFTGWTWTGTTGYAWTGVNVDAVNATNGTHVSGVWNSTFGDVELSQTITGLPNGLYTVTADLMGSSNATTSRLTTQRLFANGKSMLFGANTDYSTENLAILGAAESYSFGDYTETLNDNGPFLKLTVTAPVTDGTLTLGIRTNGLSSSLGYTFPNLTTGDGHGWFKVDNFTLTYAIDISTGLSKLENKVSYSLIDGKLMVKDVESFVVFNLQGMKVADVRQNTTNTMITLTTGIYLVKTNKLTFKVLVK